ncbi:hypothetical protein PIB30_105530, partial [Stylosanthes scabra]|nr:hypothetical protein [Stylosanthes scabra]
MASVGGLERSSENAYELVNEAVLGIPSRFVDTDSVKRLGSPSLWVRSGRNLNIKFLPCAPSERVCHKGKNAEWFFMYTCVLAEIGVRFPFTKFECVVLRQAKGVDRGLWVTVSSHKGHTLFSLFKASYKDFKDFYVKV